MTEATVSNQGQVWRGRCREGSSGGCSGVCEAVACVLSASRSRGEAHGANSCHGETLTPLNAQSGKHCRAGHMPVGESGWGMGEEGERGDAADAVEKGDSTPVKWLIKVQWSPMGGAWWRKTAREIQNPLWQTEPRVGHKPEDSRYFYLVYLGNQNSLHARNVTNRCFYFPNQSREACNVFFLFFFYCQQDNEWDEIWTWCWSPFTMHSHPIIASLPF